MNACCAKEANMQHLMQVEEVRDLVVNAASPSEAVEAVEQFLARNKNSYEAIHATVWLLVINQFRLRFKAQDR